MYQFLLLVLKRFRCALGAGRKRCQYACSLLDGLHICCDVNSVLELQATVQKQRNACKNNVSLFSWLDTCECCFNVSAQDIEESLANARLDDEAESDEDEYLSKRTGLIKEDPEYFGFVG